jgi:outer membrane protein assembly factor BamD
MTNSIKRTSFFFFFFISCAVKPTLSSLEKFKQAMLHYEKEEYADAINLFKEIIIPLTGKNEEIDTRFYLAKCFYNREEYLRAADAFGDFFDFFPNNDKTEEALYLEFVSLYKESPYSNLDQTITYRALEAIKFYIDEFPLGKYTEIAKKYKTELETKIERKDFDNLMVFYNMKNYRAAKVCCNNFEKDHLNSMILPEVLYIKILSLSELLKFNQNDFKEISQNSLVEFISSCGDFLSTYPNNIHAQDIRDMYEKYSNKKFK